MKSYYIYHLLSLVLALAVLVPAGARAEGLSVVVNSELGIEEISKSDLSKIATGRLKKWPNGKRVKFALCKHNEVKKGFLDKYVGKSPKQYELFWKRKGFTGRGTFPRQFDSAQAVVDYVGSTEGAISFIDSDEAVFLTGVTTVTVVE